VLGEILSMIAGCSYRWHQRDGRPPREKCVLSTGNRRVQRRKPAPDHFGCQLAGCDGISLPQRSARRKLSLKEPGIPSCADPIQPKAVENPKVSIVPDPKTAWQPRGGTVSFTVSGNDVSLDGVKVIVCFGWPADNWKDTKFPWQGRVSLAKFDTNSATYSASFPTFRRASCC
jgi:hypothetical protein